MSSIGPYSLLERLGALGNVRPVDTQTLILYFQTRGYILLVCSVSDKSDHLNMELPLRDPRGEKRDAWQAR